MAASAGPHDVVKLFNGANAMIPTSARLAPNGPDAPYRLEVVACGIAPQTKTSTVPRKQYSFSLFLLAFTDPPLSAFLSFGLSITVHFRRRKIADNQDQIVLII